MRKRLQITFMLCVVVMFTIQGIMEAAANPPDPRKISSGGKVWFLGAAPKKSKSKNKSPIVFVPGLGVGAHQWWGNLEYHGANDMYDLAFNKGYNTAFVELYDGNETFGFKDNGAKLAIILEEIYDHFGEKVHIVAHSKGGVDTQEALINHNAYRFVDKVIMLGSPHYGSPLANFANHWYGKWAAKIRNISGPGLQCMTPENMIEFRNEIDNHPNRKKNRYFTASGTSWGPKGSCLWWGGVYLSRFGKGVNDGLVHEESTHLPYATHLFTEEIDHDLLRKGSAIFSWIEPVLSGMEQGGKKAS